MRYEYKCVGAPERPQRVRGARTRTDRVAIAMEELIEEHAVEGWEYMRTDLVPVTERGGIFSKAEEVHRAVLVFRREAGRAGAMAGGRGHADSGEEPFRLTADMQTAPAPGGHRRQR